MKNITGKYQRFSLPRRMVLDMLHAGKQLALIPGEMRMHLGKLVAARKAARPRPSLLAMFIKAFAAVAVRYPELRRVFVSRPWHRIYECDQNIVSVVVERDWHGEAGLFLARLYSPEKMTLAEIDAQLRRFKDRPIEQIPGFVNALRIARLPWPVRRCIWGLLLNWLPRLRAKFLGTLGISITASSGVAATALLTPWTATLFYDMLDDTGALTVRAVFDHRVFDGRVLIRAFKEIERELCGSIYYEVLALSRVAAVAA